MIKRSISVASVLILFLILTITQAQTNTRNNNRSQANRRSKQKVDNTPKQILPAAASTPVTGSGTPGQITKWAGSSPTAFAVGDSGITEDKFGNVGIGTTLPTSKLTVAGMIQSTFGGFKFPDGSVQTTAGIGPTAVVRSLNALMGDVTLAPGANITLTPSANTLSISATGLLNSVIHNFSLSGSGTSGDPLGILIPLFLTGSSQTPTIVGRNNALGAGVAGFGDLGVGVYGESHSDYGVSGYSFGHSGVFGRSIGSDGVRGESGDGNGVRGESVTGTGVSGFSPQGNAVFGESEDGTGVVGQVLSGDGVLGVSDTGNGVVGQSNSGDAIVGFASSGHLAGSFIGDVTVGGNLIKSSGSFRIDHPLDPENKYLYHSFVESPDMKNIYDGVAALDAAGEAVVQMPEWFDALNKDFRYQLTCIGGFAPIYIAEKLTNRQFKIAGGQTGMEVSWQVTGIRKDLWANTHRIKVEEEKTERERGYFLHPELFNQPEEKGVEWARHPELMKQIKQEREPMKQKQRQ